MTWDRLLIGSLSPLPKQVEQYLKLWNNFKSLFSKMVVEAENFTDPHTPHGFKAAAIHKRELAAIGRKNIVHNAEMPLFGNPVHLKQWSYPEL